MSYVVLLLLLSSFLSFVLYVEICIFLEEVTDVQLNENYGKLYTYMEKINLSTLYV